MGLPKAENDQKEAMMEVIAEEEAQQIRDEALGKKVEEATGAALEGTAYPCNGVLVTVNPEVAAQPEKVDPLAFLAAQGITNIKLNFSSFPMVTLKGGSFSTPDHKAFTTKFEFKFLEQHTTYLLRAEMKDRDAEPMIAYSDDGKLQNDTFIPLEDIQAEWEENAEVDNVALKEYTILIGRILNHDGPLKNQVVQLQIPGTSKPRWDGYTYVLATEATKVSDVITQVEAGAELGKGTRKFNPWMFKRVA